MSPKASKSVCEGKGQKGSKRVRIEVLCIEGTLGVAMLTKAPAATLEGRP
jgi:hypothetical protein